MPSLLERRRRGGSQAAVIATGVTGDGAARCWGSMSATAKTAPFGPRSCARLRPVGWPGCN